MTNKVYDLGKTPKFDKLYLPGLNKGYSLEEIETSLKRLEIIDKLNAKYCDDIQTKLNDFEWLKHKLNLTFLNSLSSPEDKMRVMKIMGIEYEKEN